MEVVRERLDYEMNVIVPKGMGDYLLDRLGFYQLGQKQWHSHGPGQGFGSRVDRPISDRRHRYRTPFGFICFLNGLSTRNVSPIPILMWISAWTGAEK